MTTAKSIMDENLRSVKEGSAIILVPEGPQDVFYNPIQQFNRDLSVLAIRAFGEDKIARASSRPPRKSRRRRRQAKDVTSSEIPAHVRPESETTEEPSAKRQKLDDQNDDVPTNGARDETAQDQESRDEMNESDRQIPTQHRIRILDALSATGLRALRYAKELPFNAVITANDKSKDATKSIKQNVEHNGLQGQITVTTTNAQAHMYALLGDDDNQGSSREKYDVVDLDPYGTAAPFLDAAVQALKQGGLLCVTCTDAGVFASCGYPEKTYALYGGLPIKGLHSHEGGLRLILHAISTSAARYGFAVEPLLSLSIDFYARIFVRVRRSPADVKFLAGRTMVVYNCDSGCGSWSTQYLGRNSVLSDKNPNNIVWKHTMALAPTTSPHCPHCGFKTHLAGPMFGGPLHNPAFIQRILSYLPNLDTDVYQTIPRIEGMLTTALEECDAIAELHPASEPPSPPASNEPPQSTTGPSTSPTQPPVTTTTATTTNAASPSTSTPHPDPLPIPPVHPSTLDPHPFHLTASHLAKALHCAAPSDAQFRGALRALGHRCWRAHTKPSTIRTDAPWATVWRVMRAWVAQRARVRRRAVREGTAGWGIFRVGREEGEEGDWFVDGEGFGEGGKEGVREGVKGGEKEGEKKGVKEVEKEGEKEAREGEKGEQDRGAEKDTGPGKKDGNGEKLGKGIYPEIVFDEELGKEEHIGGKRLRRYQTNPRPNWGPMSRAKAGGNKKGDEGSSVQQ
ncbi:MAG: RNA methyltransferase tRNA(m5U54)methyltransferase [Bathelium mastoideum]|nr:MAG: RNA methyltransferase tRNA(m5U54)methyltransferase [Bathelium mastoideum]